MLQGTNMGIIEGRKILNNKKVDTKISKLLNAFVKIQEKNVEENSARPVPEWLEKDIEKLSGKVVRLAAREDIDIPIEEHLIVELYSK